MDEGLINAYLDDSNISTVYICTKFFYAAKYNIVTFVGLAELALLSWENRWNSCRKKRLGRE